MKTQVKKQAEDNRLSEALKDFRKNYPNVDSSDLQTFILGFQAATQWHSPDEKPKIKGGVSEDLLLLLCDEDCYCYDIGCYFKSNNEFDAYHSDNKYIIKWMYLPEIWK